MFLTSKPFYLIITLSWAGLGIEVKENVDENWSIIFSTRELWIVKRIFTYLLSTGRVSVETVRELIFELLISNRPQLQNKLEAFRQVL